METNAMNKLKLAEKIRITLLAALLLLLAIFFLPIGDGGSGEKEISLQPIIDSDDKISPEVESMVADAATGKTDKISVIVESTADVSSAVKKSKGKITGKADVGKLKFSAVEISPNKVEKLAENSEVENIYPIHTYYPTLAESVPLTNAKAFWDAGYKGSGVKVAVLDTGVDKNHPMLSGRVVAERDFSNSGTANDRLGHGTHVAGIIAGTTASGGSYNGIAPDATLLNGKVIGDDEKGYTTSIIEAIDWAMDNGADVISMSLGAPTLLDSAMDDAIREAVASGVVVVVSSGNCGSGCPSYKCGSYRGVTSPGSSPSAISVGAVDKNKQVACFSSGDNIEGVGVKPDIVAPGVSITSSVPNSGYQAKDGTSMSAPHVSGAAALLLQKNPELSPADVKHVLEATSTDLGPAGKDTSYGAGILDLTGALNFYSELEFRVSMNNQLTAGNKQHIEVQVFDDIPMLEVKGKITKPDSATSAFTFSSTDANTYAYDYTDTSALGNYNAEITVKYQTAASTEDTATGERTAFYSQSFRVTLPAGDFGNVEAVSIAERQFYSKNLTGSIYFRNTAAEELEVSLLLQLLEDGSAKQEMRIQATKVAAGETTAIMFNQEMEVQPGNYTLLIITDYGAGSLLNETNITAIDDLPPKILSVSYQKSIRENNPQGITVKLKETARLSNISVSGGSVSGKCDTEACGFAVTQLPAPLSLNYTTKLVSETENEKDLSITLFNGLVKDSIHLIELTICDEYNNCAEKAEVRFDVRGCDGKGLLIVKTNEEKSVFEEAAASSSACLSVLDRSTSGTPPASYLERFDAIVFTTGTDVVNINDDDAEALLDYYGKKGRVIVEGSDVAFRHGNDELMREVLHATLKEDIGFTVTSSEELSKLSINATRPHPLMAGLQNPMQFNATRDQFPDSISALNGGIELASWAGLDANGSAMVAYESDDGTKKSLLMPFDIAALDAASSGRLAENAIDWLLENSTADIKPTEIRYSGTGEYPLIAKKIPKDVYCIQVCYPVWELTSGACKFNECGSPCEIDNTTTFVREAECELAKDYFAGKGNGIIVEGEQFMASATIGSAGKPASPLNVRVLVDGAVISEGEAKLSKLPIADEAPPVITKIDYASRIVFGTRALFISAITEENELSVVNVSVAADLCFNPDVMCFVGGVGELVPVKSSWKLVSGKGDEKTVAVAIDTAMEKGRYYAKIMACDLSGNCGKTKQWLPFTVTRLSGCGDGVCQSVTCLAIGCPIPETPTSCPEDCAKTKSLDCTAIAEPLLQPKGYLNCLAEDGAELESVIVDWQSSGGSGDGSVSGGQDSAQHNYSYNFDASLNAGQHIVTVFSNSDFSIKENNYVNNIKEFTLTVYPKPPDLKIGSMNYSYDDSEGLIIANLDASNFGGTDAATSIKVYLDNYEKDKKDAILKAGETKTFRFELPSEKGAYSFKAEIDTDNHVEEYNETNNEWKETIYLCSREKVLVVDDNDGLFYSTAAPSSAEEFVSILRDKEYCVEKWDEAEKGTPPPEFAETFPLIVWSAGDYFGNITTDADRELLKNYGRSILIEGSDIAMELAEGNQIEALTGSSFSQDLMIEETELVLKEHQITEGIDSIRINSEKSPYPDAVEAAGGEAVAEWPNGKAAITAAAGSRKTAYYGFSVDGITDAAVMEKLVENTIQWLLDKPNTPPKIDGLLNETVTAGEKATITINAIDADNDELTYSVNDSRFIAAQPLTHTANLTTFKDSAAEKTLAFASKGSISAQSSGLTISLPQDSQVENFTLALEGVRNPSNNLVIEPDALRCDNFGDVGTYVGEPQSNQEYDVRYSQPFVAEGTHLLNVTLLAIKFGDWGVPNIEMYLHEWRDGTQGICTGNVLATAYKPITSLSQETHFNLDAKELTEGAKYCLSIRLRKLAPRSYSSFEMCENLENKDRNYGMGNAGNLVDGKGNIPKQLVDSYVASAAKAKFIYAQYPSDISIKLGEETLHNLNGALTTKITAQLDKSKVNSYISNCSKTAEITEGSCDVPLEVYSSKQGTLRVSKLNATYLVKDATRSKGNIFTWQTGKNDAGEYSVEAKVNDSEEAAAGIVNITVLVEKNSAPQIANLTFEEDNKELRFEAAAVPRITMKEGETKNFSVLATDPDGDLLSYAWLLNGTAVSATQNFSFSPKYNESGDYNITIIVSDGKAEAKAEFLLVVMDTMDCDPSVGMLSCPLQLGVCMGSAETCGSNGKWQGCMAATYATYNSSYEETEVSCDALDNDCNGEVDERFDDVDNDGTADCIDDDNDNDGIKDDVDDLIGDGSDIEFEGEAKDIRIKVEHEEGEPEKLKKVRINNSDKPLLEFEYDFGKGNVPLRNISVEKQNKSSDKGYIVVKGLNLRGHTKSVFVDKLVAASNAVCVKDKEVSEISEVSDSCSGENEKLLDCSVEPEEAASCSLKPETGQFVITGLKHSAVMEQCTDADGDGYLPEGCDSGRDCNDSNDSISPTAAETCNAADDNCNGQVDENRACNTPPKLQAIGNKTAAENSAIKFTITATDSEADELLYNSTGLPEGAGFDNKTAEFTWTPSFEQFGTYATSFSVSDGLLSDSEAVNITVANINRAPLIERIDGTLTANENEDIVIAAVATDPDGDSLTYSVNDSRFTELKETSDAGDFAWRTGYEDSGAYAVLVTVSDGSLSSSKDVIVTVADVNRPPVIADIGNKTAYENKTLSFTLHASNPDGDALTWSLKPSDIAGMTLESAEFSWTPSFDQAGIYQVTFNVSDGLAFDYELINITVINANRAPVIDSVSPSENAVVNENEPLEFSAVTSDPDGDSLSYSWKLNDLELSTLSSYVFSPSFEDAGEHLVAVTITDGELNDSKEIMVTVLNVNRPPSLDALSNATAKENEIVAIAPTATDPDGDTTYFSFTTPLDEKGTWKTTFEDAGEYTANVTASDGSLNDTTEINITITNVNRPPVIQAVLIEPAGLVMNEGETKSFFAAVYDGDDDALETTWKVNGEAKSTEPVFVFTADYEGSGEYVIELVAGDSESTSSTTMLLTVQDTLSCGNGQTRPCALQEGVCSGTIEVCTGGEWPGCSDEDYGVNYRNNELDNELRCDGLDNNCDGYADEEGVCNTAPELAPVGNMTVKENETLEFTLAATDKESDTLKFTASYYPYINAKLSAEGKFTWTPDFDRARTYVAAFSVSDGLQQDNETINITVQNVNRAPQIFSLERDPQDKPVEEGSLALLKANVDDPDKDDLKYKWLREGKIVSYTKHYRFLPNYTDGDADKGNIHEFIFTAEDDEFKVNSSIQVPVQDALNCKPKSTETATCGTSNVGICKQGTRTMTCGADYKWSEWSNCTGEVKPAAEDCGTWDDDDCDGEVNEQCEADLATAWMSFKTYDTETGDITSSSLSNASPTMRVWYYGVVTNIGKNDSPPTLAMWYLNKRSQQREFIPKIKPMQGIPVHMITYIPYEGDNNATLVLDVNNTLPELNEKNNEMNFRVRVAYNETYREWAMKYGWEYYLRSPTRQECESQNGKCW